MYVMSRSTKTTHAITQCEMPGCISWHLQYLPTTLTMLLLDNPWHCELLQEDMRVTFSGRATAEVELLICHITLVVLSMLHILTLMVLFIIT